MSEPTCPTCGPTTVEQHPRRPGVTRCGNCKEWLTRPEHRPVGAYLPVGQLDGDCACGRGAYPCPDPQPSAAPETDASALREAERTRLRIAVDHDETHGDGDYNTTEHLFAAVERIVAERVRVVEGERDAARAEGEISGQMRHITAEMARGDQPLEAKEELIADLRARLSHVEAERDGWRDRAATNRDGWRQMLARAESAEAAHEALVAAVEALIRKPSGARHWTKQGRHGSSSVVDVDDLRALLAGDAR